MKIYSDQAVTSTDITNVLASIDQVDTKQSKQIDSLRLWLAASFVFNVALTLALHFL
jgi:hypothetical protein